MDKQRQDDQLEPIYNNTVLIQDVDLKTYRVRWTIETGGGRGSGRSVLMVQHDDDDDFKLRLCLKVKICWLAFLSEEFVEYSKLIFLMKFFSICVEKIRLFASK